jgi:hypothetical protein
MREACAEVFESWIVSASERLRESGLTAKHSRALAISMFCSLEGAFVLARAQRSTEPLEIAGAAQSEAVRLALAARRRRQAQAARQ